MKECSIKIIRLPSFFRKRQFSSKLNCSLIPPLALGLICGYVRSKGIKIEQDDLNIRIHYDNTYLAQTEDEIDTEVFFDIPRVTSYAEGRIDLYLDSLMRKAAKKVKISDHQIILLSLPDNIENDTNLMFAMAFSSFIKKRHNTINIIGGESLWLDLLRIKYSCKQIDYIIYGEGEIAVEHLLSHIINGKNNLNETPGLLVEDGGKVIRSDLSLRPIKPDFTGLPLEKYKSREEVLEYSPEVAALIDEFQASNTLVLPYRFIRGCPFECIFCVSSVKNLSHTLTVEEVGAHLKSLQEEYRPSGFFFLEDTVNISKKYINDLCDEIIKNKINILWSDCARVDNLDRETIFKMRRAGCIRLIFGMETASPRLLKYINKKIDLRQLENTLRWADEAGIWAGLEVICGLPHENEDDIRATIAFLNANQEYINRVYLNHFDLRENTPLYNEPDKYGLERILEVNQYAQKDFISYVRFGFNETGGLTWPDKVRQIEHSLVSVQDNCRLGLRYFTDEHLLFFLYSRFTDKKKINSIYLKIVRPNN